MAYSLQVRRPILRMNFSFQDAIYMSNNIILHLHAYILRKDSRNYTAIPPLTSGFGKVNHGTLGKTALLKLLIRCLGS